MPFYEKLLKAFLYLSIPPNYIPESCARRGKSGRSSRIIIILFTQFLDLIGTLPQPKSLFRYEFTSPTSLDRSQKHHVEIFFHPKMAAKRLKEKERKRSSKSDKPPQTISVVEYDEPRGEIAGYEEEAVAEILAAEIVHGKPYTCPADKPSKG